MLEEGEEEEEEEEEEEYNPTSIIRRERDETETAGI